MNTHHTQVVLITGASSGVGKSCAEYLSRKGYKVYGTSREHQSLAKNFELFKMDVTSEASVEQGIDYIFLKEGRLDVAINNAGIGIAGSIENASIEFAKKQFETNFFGTFRVCAALLPRMRQQGSGLIVNISSIAGVLGLPFQSLYSASKFAIEGMTEGMRMEVRKFGIKVTLLEPGDLHTNFTKNREKIECASQNPVYRAQFDQTLTIVERDETNGPSSEVVAKCVYKIMQKKSPKVRYTVGRFDQRLVPGLKRVLPAKIFERLISGYYKL